MSENEHNGTEEPTQRRRERARNDGQAVQSQDLTAALTLLMACGVFMVFGRSLAAQLMNAIRLWVMDVPPEDWSAWHFNAGAWWFSSEAVTFCGGLIVAVMATGTLVGFLQVGFVISLKPLEIDWEKILPSRGWARLWSLESGIRGLQGSAKMVFLTIGTATLLWIRRHRLVANGFDSVGQVVGFAWDLGLSVGLLLAGLSLALAVTDYLIKWMRNEQKLKMTREEIKQEQKDDSGDPHIKAAIRRKQREALKQQSVKDVPKASFVVTNPTHLAVALQYETGTMSAPRVVAKGAGVFAKNIVRIAKENNIPVLERKPLARALFATVDVGQLIPFEFFRTVAEILAQIYRTKRAG